MLCIDRSETDPYFNIAAEEYFLKEFTSDIFMVWQNSRSIIMGKHQNMSAEINLDFAKEKGIPVIRRLSGGGTVFHDQGNLNYTFIFSGKQDSLVNYSRYTRPIIAFLETLDINARFVGKSDLKVGHLKFSGNAEHIYRSRVLHHGTLLFATNLDELEKTLDVVEIELHKKYIRSNRSLVTNISSHLTQKMDIREFKDRLFSFVMDLFENSTIYNLTNHDRDEIELLVEHKYRTKKWNFGR